MKVFISGGCKNGKSTHAERIASLLSRQCGGPLYYIATMEPHDDEDLERIARHRESRAALNFITVEMGRDIARLAATCLRRGTYLLDSATALLANEMFGPESIQLNAAEKVSRDLLMLGTAVENIVVVSDFIYAGPVFYDEYTEAYRRGLAFIDQSLAAEADIVCEAVAGQLIAYKGSGLLRCIYENAV